ncbi:MAG TPA: phytoene/squalene synthase family protein [Bacillota bacterium]|nr:phytoene/squalene synthase family protein [Bacillota bacterium]
MSVNRELQKKQAMDMLLTTSRTFFIPISRLPEGLQEAVSSGYLCMRAIDEIEDHPELPCEDKAHLLRSVSKILLNNLNHSEFTAVFHPYKSLLPEVTLCMEDWLSFCPTSVLPQIKKSTAIMAEGMADWAEKAWHIQTEEDLDNYTYYVAGLVGTMLSKIWVWYDGTQTDHDLAVAFGRGLQAVNIIRNRTEDVTRGAHFYPEGWGEQEMFAYARRNLALADLYTGAIAPGPILDFCKIPLILAHATLQVMAAGESKLSRAAVTELVGQVTRK